MKIYKNWAFNYNVKTGIFRIWFVILKYFKYLEEISKYLRKSQYIYGQKLKLLLISINSFVFRIYEIWKRLILSFVVFSDKGSPAKIIKMHDYE